ncbi:MAG: winged helix-turn-helix transcriptional regulator [Promethearchaeota archaeon]
MHEATIYYMEPGENDIISLIGKKGTISILGQLQHVPKRYNQLNGVLKSCMSSRTLDHRLKEMVGNGLIAVREFADGSLKGMEYSITNHGLLLRCMFLSRPKTSCDFTLDDVVAKLRDEWHRAQKYCWKRVWADITRVLKEHEYIETLRYGKKNFIETWDEESIVVRTERGISTIDVSSIKNAWENLMIHGELQRQDHARMTYRSSFICALLSHLEYVGTRMGRSMSIFIK